VGKILHVNFATVYVSSDTKRSTTNSFHQRIYW